ncbi:uncharacterized protein LOC6577208 [Drosophila mojavensis]|uniref:LRRCT domain-containing protein n=1 Tax=Drosophila mojavensis TaxID=7230 RepID=B4KK88_DROMO|nr:uncharacterized protein LOC6577208 [Drosophila mojavensis]EDW12619.1 uncharacterized protein Dmoj_GI23818 [Drosophila mojavensis]
MRHASLLKWNANEPMTHCSTASTGSYALSLPLPLPLPLLLFMMLLPAVVVGAESSCLIRATLYVTPPEQRSVQDFGLPLDIDCAANGSATGGAVFDLGAQRVAGKLHVRLNGSQTPPLADVAGYGLAYLDNCAQLESVEIERFVLEDSLPLSCGTEQEKEQELELERLRVVTLRHNELGTLSGNSFALLPHLQQLLLEDNSLRLLEPLEGCRELQELSIRRERQLALRQAELLEQLEQLQRLELTQLKLVRREFLEALPGQLTELLVQQTLVEPRHLRLGNGTEQLLRLSLVECELSSFALDASISSKLQQLNLSGNALRELQLSNSSLISLDLSANHLRSLNSTWFAQLQHLQSLQLQQNQLHSVSWPQVLQLAPGSLTLLDLSSNELVRLEQTELAAWEQVQQLHIHIDDNPWSCQWLLNFSHDQPQLFRLFRYAKYISLINVNGLSCKPQLEKEKGKGALEPSTSRNKTEGNWSVSHGHLNVSSHTVLYGNPLQQSHSQRSEALVIVFMLPLGIALLFLLLYLYLHCERMFHWSYYSGGLPCFGGGKASSNHRFVDHIDIVRYPIANGSSSANVAEELDQPIALADGYETPVSGSASICNCAGPRQSHGSCSRTHHVTYEAMPTDLPYQLYTEIKEPTDTNEADEAPAELPAASAPIYERLGFEEEQPMEV